MSTRVAIMHQLINQQRTLGLDPQEIHANQATVTDFVREAKLQPVPGRDKRSLFARLRGENGTVDIAYRFDDCLIVANDAIPGGNIILRPQMLMLDPNWLENIKFSRTGDSDGLQTPPADGSTPWHEKTQQSKPSDADGGVLEMLADAGGVSPTSVLIKAMDGMESVNDVVVLRFHSGGNVSMCATMDRWRLMGALQDALAYVMRGE